MTGKASVFKTVAREDMMKSMKKSGATPHGVDNASSKDTAFYRQDIPAKPML
jgi:hypothetical protein